MVFLRLMAYDSGSYGISIICGIKLGLVVILL